MSPFLLRFIMPSSHQNSPPDDPTEVSRLLEEVVRRLEEESRFDIEAFLETHAAFASEILERLRQLSEVGLFPGECPDAEDENPWHSHAEADSISKELPYPTDPNRYEILELIADGGMGTIFRAFDRSILRHVAIKTARLHGASKSTAETIAARLRRFVDEARVTGSLEHPNIVPVHDFGVLPSGKLYLTMKLVEGQTWAEALAADDSALRIPNGVAVLLQVCEAVSFSHSRGVIHRDLKPDNIMIGRFGEVLVMDWGLLKVLDDETSLVEEKGGFRVLCGKRAF